MNKVSASFFVLVLLSLSQLFLLACIPISPTPDIEATVAAKVQSTLAAAPIATPPPSPTPTRTPRPTPTAVVEMTVVEYASWCESLIALNPDLHDEVTNREVVEALGNQIDEYRKVTPPGELKDYHAANRSALVAMRDALSAEPPAGSFAIGVMVYATLLAYPDILRAESELSADTYFLLAEAHCIYDETLDTNQDLDSFWSVPGSSISDPVEIGGTLEGVDGTEIVVTNTVRDAWPMMASHYAAQPPKAGHRFYMISVEMAYISGAGSIYITDSDFRLLDDGLILIHPRCGYEYAVPDRLSGEVFVGGRITGNVCFEVRNEAKDFILVHQPDWDTSSRRFLRLE